MDEPWTATDLTAFACFLAIGLGTLYLILKIVRSRAQ